jgi:hypothetical protein
MTSRLRLDYDRPRTELFKMERPLRALRVMVDAEVLGGHQGGWTVEGLLVSRERVILTLSVCSGTMAYAVDCSGGDSAA